MANEIAIRLYRVAKTYPPSDDEYLTPQQLGRKQRPGLSDEVRRSWDALSCWDSEDGARKIGRQWEQTIEAGHYDLRGDMEELKGYLAADCVAVEREEPGSRTMTYRVFDTGINKLLGVFPTEADAMRLVRMLLSGDEDFAEDLAVSCELDDGRFSPPLSGDELVARAEAVGAKPDRADGRPHDVSPSHRGSGTSGSWGMAAKGSHG